MTINLTQLASQMHLIAAVNPEFKYKSPTTILGCQYAHRDEEGCIIAGEGCIVGRSLADLGLEMKQSYEGHVAEYLIISLIEKGLIEADESEFDTLRLISRVQAFQDEGEVWSDAFRKAHLPERYDAPRWFNEALRERFEIAIRDARRAKREAEKVNQPA